MTAARPRFNVPPRGLTRGELAGYLGHGESWLTDERLEQLYAMGFPRPDSFTERFDRVAADAWLDQRSGLTAGDFDDGLSRRLEDFGNGAAS
jgi:hypothetical protein